MVSFRTGRKHVWRQIIKVETLSDATERETRDPDREAWDQKAWEAPNLETLDVASTEGGAAPKNNENPNFYVG